MLMHEWLKYREQQIKKAGGQQPEAEGKQGVEAEREHLADERADATEEQAEEEATGRYTEARRIAAEVSERTDEAQSSRLQALLARQQRLPLEVEAAQFQSSEGRRRAQENREQLVERLLDPTLTVSETATLLGVCPTTVRRYTKRGVLNCFRTPGNQRRFKLSDIISFMEEQQRQ